MSAETRLFHVCMSIGLNGYVEVAAKSKREALALAKKLVVTDVKLYDPADIASDYDLKNEPHQFPEEYERVFSRQPVIDLEEIGKPKKPKRRRDGEIMSETTLEQSQAGKEGLQMTEEHNQSPVYPETTTPIPTETAGDGYLLNAEQIEEWFTMCPPHRSLLSRGALEPAENCLVCMRNERNELREALVAVWRKINPPVYRDTMKSPRPLYVCEWCGVEHEHAVEHATNCPVSLVRRVMHLPTPDLGRDDNREMSS